MSDIEVLPVTFPMDGKEVEAYFIFLEGGDITACLLKGYRQNNRFPQDNQARKRLPVSGATVRHPNDDPDQDYAMRLAMWRACFNIDGNWQFGQENNGHNGNVLGPVGRKIYSAYRGWKFEQNYPLTVETIDACIRAIISEIKEMLGTYMEKKDDPTKNNS